MNFSFGAKAGIVGSKFRKYIVNIMELRNS